MAALNQAEHLATQSRVELLSRLLLDTDPAELDRFIEAGERANAIGPLLDPTAWIRGADTLSMVLDHARALRTARRQIKLAAERAGVPTHG